MLKCTQNLRQTNENVEECIKSKHLALNKFYDNMGNIYHKQNVKFKLISDFFGQMH
jgi:hypothetical protein